ncbi:unnamed protein product [Schistosoma margrebowiei]|uniref:Uncharacterized protein n=1 Tax=Schistosoma margrebowiei TaxID=48269 RepID=A0A183M794_9TREM|nr:unnamed protein product [Schistosoma margrebowiei]
MWIKLSKQSFENADYFNMKPMKPLSSSKCSLVPENNEFKKTLRFSNGNSFLQKAFIFSIISLPNSQNEGSLEQVNKKFMKRSHNQKNPFNWFILKSLLTIHTNQIDRFNT